MESSIQTGAALDVFQAVEPEKSIKDLCVELEHFETPRWAAEAILQKEVMTNLVLDPCTGSGVLSIAARNVGYDVVSMDIQRWGYPLEMEGDFLKLLEVRRPPQDFTVFMNPPFSKAVEFVEHSFRLGARKIIAFQRLAWYESKKRRAFWEKCPPNRIYICGDRADCWRHDIPESERAGRSTPTAHAWFVWDRGNPSGTLIGHVYKL